MMSKTNVNHTRFLTVIALFFGFHSRLIAADAAVDLRVAIYPYLPEAESAIERLEEAFEDHSEASGLSVDLDLVLLNTYGSAITNVLEYDIAEIDLCMFDEIRSQLDPIPQEVFQENAQWVGPARGAMKQPWSRFVLPHWVCGNFLVHSSEDQVLSKASNFESILEALEPGAGRFVFADLWGGGTLGEFYADAVLDRYGADCARSHLTDLAETDPDDVAEKLRADAVLALWRLIQEMRPEHLEERAALHNLNFVYPREFIVDRGQDSILVGYSERLHYAERRLQEQPWSGRRWPIPDNTLSVRQFPFGTNSQGTPTWVDAFVIPKGKLESKKEVIMAFLRFARSEAGYRCFLEPREYYPGAYLLPADARVFDFEFVKSQLPHLDNYRDCIDSNPFPVIDGKIYQGIDKAGNALKTLFEEQVR